MRVCSYKRVKFLEFWKLHWSLQKMAGSVVYRLIIVILFIFVAAGLLRDSEAQPAKFNPTTFVPEDQDQCVDTRESPLGKHAFNEIDREIRDRLTDEISPMISRLFGKCAVGNCEENPAFSCAELREINDEVESGLYWLRLPNGSSVYVHCDFDRECTCSKNDSFNSWLRVAFHNMSNPNHSCPFNFQENEIEQRRMCHTKLSGCTSVFFDTLGVTYDRVCGRVIGVQFGEPNAFRPYYKDRERTLEDPYVDGISLTHGHAPRTHVWTFVMVEDETQYDDEACPCTKTDQVFTGVIPPFVDNDYFCDTGARGASEAVYYTDDPLWDGAGCGATSTCCEWQNPPWFCKHLTQPTKNDLEFRVCADSISADEQLLIELIEIYIQ